MKNRIEVNEQEHIMESLYRYVGYQHCENVAREFDEISKLAKDMEYPKELDDWFAGYLEKVKKSEKKAKRMAAAKRIANKAAMAAIVLGVGLVLATFSVDAFRIEVLNFLIETTQKYTSIQVGNVMDKEEKVPATWSSYYLPEYIIDGYSLSSVQEFSDIRLIYFQNTNGEVIKFSQSFDNDNYQIDTENTEATEVMINGAKGILVDKDGVVTLLWNNSDYTFYLTGKADKEEIVKMAESIKLIKQQ